MFDDPKATLLPPMMSGAKSALILGATGATGSRLLQELLQSPTFSRIGEYGRRVTLEENVTVGKEKLVQKTIDFEDLAEADLGGGNWDVVFITLGTLRRATPSSAVFEKIDREYVVNAARLARRNDQPQRLVYLSALSANPESRVLYSRSKGLTELDLAGLGYDDVITFRAGVITERGDGRFLEGLVSHVLSLRTSWVERWASPIPVLAKAMRVAGELGSEGLPSSIGAMKAGELDPSFTFLPPPSIHALAREGSNDD